MVVSEEPRWLSSEDCVRPGVDGAVEMEGEGEGELGKSREIRHFESIADALCQCVW